MVEPTTDKKTPQEFAIHRLFVKDFSFEAPDSPSAFKDEWTPEVDLNLDNTHEFLEENLYDVTLKVTATVKIKVKTVYNNNESSIYCYF